MSSSNSPCAACKCLRRKCTQECVFAPYFPPDQPQKFANVHKVFGASNVTKLLNELNVSQREDAVNSLAYEAQQRLRDPVYGCVGWISILQHRLKQVHIDLYNAKKELAAYIGPSAMLPIIPHPGYIQQLPLANPISSGVMPYNNMTQMLGFQVGQGNQLVIRDPQQQQQQQQQHHQQMLEAQQLAAIIAAREQQELMRSYEQQHLQHPQQQDQREELLRFNSEFDLNGGGPDSGIGFNQMTTISAAAAAASPAMSPTLALSSFDNSYQIQHQQQEQHHSHLHHQLQTQLILQTQPPEQHDQQLEQQPETQQQQHDSTSDDCRSVGPSC